MPTTDIIGYLWSNRQQFGLETIPDALILVADLQQVGLDCVRVQEMKVFGVPTGTSVQFVRMEENEWSDLVQAAIVESSIAHTAHMIHRESDPE